MLNVDIYIEGEPPARAGRARRDRLARQSIPMRPKSPTLIRKTRFVYQCRRDARPAAASSGSLVLAKTCSAASLN